MNNNTTTTTTSNNNNNNMRFFSKSLFRECSLHNILRVAAKHWKDRVGSFFLDSQRVGREGVRMQCTIRVDMLCQ